MRVCAPWSPDGLSAGLAFCGAVVLSEKIQSDALSQVVEWVHGRSYIKLVKARWRIALYARRNGDGQKCERDYLHVSELVREVCDDVQGLVLHLRSGEMRNKR